MCSWFGSDIIILTMELFSCRRRRLYWSVQVESCSVYVKTQKVMQHMHGIIAYMLDCWADPVVHLLLLPNELHALTHFR